MAARHYIVVNHFIVPHQYGAATTVLPFRLLTFLRDKCCRRLRRLFVITAHIQTAIRTMNNRHIVWRHFAAVIITRNNVLVTPTVTTT